MRILHVLPSIASRAGGPASQFVGAARAHADVGVAATVFSSDLPGAPQAPRRDRNGPVVPPLGAEQLDLHVFRTRLPRRWAFSPDMWRALRGRIGEFDVVHIHSLFLFPQLAAYLAASRGDIPYIVAPCGALAPYLRPRSSALKAVMDRTWQRRMLDGAAFIHYKTAEEQRQAADLALTAPPAIVPNGIDWSAFQNPRSGEGFRLRNGVPPHEPLVLSISRISRKKGYDILISAFGQVLREIPSARLVIAGPDDESLIPELRRLAASGGFEDRVRFAGMLDESERLTALAAADVWALPSHDENFGNVVLEAMAARKATVVSSAVALADEIAAAGAGSITDPMPEPFAREILSLLSDSARREALAAEAREFARRFDWSDVVYRLIDMYSAAMSERAGDARPVAAARSH
jgi:glycosyltransferase involved in cell wall biosynthesis